MVVSMRVMSAGAGYQYLLRSVVAGEGDRSLSTPITRYCAEAGTPPGRWLGSGLGALGNGELTSGDQVTEAQLALLVGVGRDPITGEQLGRAYPVYKSTDGRVAERVKALDAGLSVEEHAAAKAGIEAEEASSSRRRPVAAYDVTFSFPKMSLPTSSSATPSPLIAPRISPSTRRASWSPPAPRGGTFISR